MPEKWQLYPNEDMIFHSLTGIGVLDFPNFSFGNSGILLLKAFSSPAFEATREIFEYSKCKK